MIYNIFFTDISKKELRQIYLYIKINLESPFTAKELIKRIIKAIQDLNFMPNRFPIYKKLYDEITLRRMPIENFSVFYSVDESNQRVTIHKVIYNKRDIDNIIQ
ncbi:MAG: type II toxin-antitoxin system RelE/ParE family toxin [Candidatus Riflebacteria bacterium]|nr:type II toxin-antitoxin system RelE/ParE family toxin [Candidatus Riflebacteria bacterium]